MQQACFKHAHNWRPHPRPHPRPPCPPLHAQTMFGSQAHAHEWGACLGSPPQAHMAGMLTIPKDHTSCTRVCSGLLSSMLHGHVLAHARNNSQLSGSPKSQLPRPQHPRLDPPQATTATDFDPKCLEVISAPISSGPNLMLPLVLRNHLISRLFEAHSALWP